MSPPGEGGSCPICSKPRDAKFRPFCSKRCADLDLGRWLRGEYAIPGAPPSLDEGLSDQDEDPELN
jgi:endogenous inhibitor of DNA gyrase (YacG/DUF329 family)